MTFNKASSSLNPQEIMFMKQEFDNKVDKVSGKGLSTNDYTDVDKAKVQKLNNYELIYEADLEPSAGSLTIDKDKDGKAFRLIKVLIEGEMKSTTTANKYVFFDNVAASTNSQLLAPFASTTKQCFTFVLDISQGLGNCEVNYGNYTTSKTSHNKGNLLIADYIDKIRFTGLSLDAEAPGSIKVYGVRA